MKRLVSLLLFSVRDDGFDHAEDDGRDDDCQNEFVDRAILKVIPKGFHGQSLRCSNLLRCFSVVGVVFGVLFGDHADVV